MLKKLILLSVFWLSACGWHFKNEEAMPEALRTLTFESVDKNGDMSRILRQQLLLNQVNLVVPQKDVAILTLNQIRNSSSVASVFKQAREAEKILTVTAFATLTLPHKGSYPLEVVVHRTFFDDSRAALAKSAEQEMILKDMYEQASRQLIIKMIGLSHELNQKP